jgi:general secretion pathway protein H
MLLKVRMRWPVISAARQGMAVSFDHFGGTVEDGGPRTLWPISERSTGPERRPISSRRRTDRDRSQAGVTLIEMVCVLGIFAMLAAILLPRMPMATSRPRLESYAVEVAALLKADRNAALERSAPVAAVVDARGRTVRSGSSPRIIHLPDDVAFEALLPQRCNGRPAFSTISFFATGMSCGGTISLTRFGSGFEVRVNWLTGGVDIVTQDAL